MGSNTHRDGTEDELDLSNRPEVQHIGITSLLPSRFRSEFVRKLRLDSNHLTEIPSVVFDLLSLDELDVSNNEISSVHPRICSLSRLRILVARNNRLSALPLQITKLSSIEIVNLSGNSFEVFPKPLCYMFRLKELYIGGNLLTTLNPEIENLKELEILYLGGNKLEVIPSAVGQLCNLLVLVLCDNLLSSVPRELALLTKLRSLSLHKNRIRMLPAEIVMLYNLSELSLRDNPLVDDFVQDLVFDPPSLLEICGRGIKNNRVAYVDMGLPKHLEHYLNSAKHCLNPKCKGVYFDSRVKSVRFVDFCGKFRLPLEQYLCSNHTREGARGKDSTISAQLLRKVLLG